MTLAWLAETTRLTHPPRSTGSPLHLPLEPFFALTGSETCRRYGYEGRWDLVSVEQCRVQKQRDIVDLRLGVSREGMQSDSLHALLTLERRLLASSRLGALALTLRPALH